MAKLNHPSVLNFVGFSPIDFKKRPRPVIITEYASNGTLEDLILKKNPQLDNYYDDTRKLIIIYGIASAMSYLHSHNIIHRDLKPANILMDDFLFPKIADFGLSKVKHSNLNSITQNSAKFAVKGTPIYMSPEIWGNAEYSQFSDVYEFAIIVYEMITNLKPFHNFHFFEIYTKVKAGYRPEFKNEIQESYRELITSCWSDEPSSRPTFGQIVSKLKNDRSFITEKIDENEFRKYVKYVDEYESTFNQMKVIDCLDLFNKFFRIEKLNYDELNEYFSVKSVIFPFKNFLELEESCKKIVIEAEKDINKKILLGKYLIEGQELFPRKIDIGLKYLKESMKLGSIESSIYYCKMLIKGDLIHRNIKKAKKILETIIKQKDLGEYLSIIWKNKHERERL